MQTFNPKHFKPLEQPAFPRLEATAFPTLEQPSFLKGLFKGKGAYHQWASHCRELQAQLIGMARNEVIPQFQFYPLAMLPAQLILQSTGAGTAFLRWRNPDRSVMGVKLWEDMMQNISPDLLDDLYAIELHRIGLNMLISLAHSQARQAMACASKAEQAENCYRQRKEETQ